MAIYSCNHKAIGRSTHKPFTAAAHVNYITRASATTEIMASSMPTDRHEAVKWIKAQELADRKNARVCDKIMVALPVELTPEQRRELVRDFCQQLTKDRCPYYAAIHAEGKDANNPHAHIVIRDRDKDTGKRFLNMSEQGSTENVRELWEHVCNTHLAMHGHSQRIDRRALDKQGIDRTPQIHVGPRANEAIKRDYQLVSKIRHGRRGREIRYPDIDKGMTRRAFNESIIDLNLERLKKSADYGTRLKARYEIEQRQKDRALLQKREGIRHGYQKANGKIWKEYSTNRGKLVTACRREKDQAVENVKQRYKLIWADHFKRKERALKDIDYIEQAHRSKLGNLKEIMQGMWRDKDTAQSKDSKLLTHIFEHHRKKETRLKAIKQHFKAENRQIYQKYTEHKNRALDEVRRNYDPFFKMTERDWKKKKDALKERTGGQWQQYKQEAKERRTEKRQERENLEQGLKDYYREAAEGKAAEPEHGESTTGKSAAEKMAEQRKRQQDRDKGKGKGKDHGL